MVRAAIGLGSNLGDRARHIAQAVESLRELGDIVASSAIYETDPVGGPEQGPFFNAVVVIETKLTAHALLEECLRIEAEHGRERRQRWGPRTLDLDILLFGDDVIAVPGLTVPHPRLRDRRFVLEPLLEAWPEATLPDGTALRGSLAAVADQRVRRLAGPLHSRSLTAAAIAVTIGGALAIWWLADWLVGRL